MRSAGLLRCVGAHPLETKQLDTHERGNVIDNAQKERSEDMATVRRAGPTAEHVIRCAVGGPKRLQNRRTGLRRVIMLKGGKKRLERRKTRPRSLFVRLRHVPASILQTSPYAESFLDSNDSYLGSSRQTQRFVTVVLVSYIFVWFGPGVTILPKVLRIYPAA